MNIREYLIRTAYENEDARGLILPLVSLRTASEEALVSRVIKLAYENLELREYVLPFFTGDVFKEAGSKGNKGKNKQKRRQKKEMKNRRREKRVQKDQNKKRNPLGVSPTNMKQFELAMINEKYRIKGSKKGELAHSTVWGYAMDETAKLHLEAKKVMQEVVEKWNNSQAKKFLKKTAEVASEALEASKVVSDIAGEMIAEMGVAGEQLGAKWADSAMSDFKDAKETFDGTKTVLDQTLGAMAEDYAKEVGEQLKKSNKEKGDELAKSAEGIDSEASALALAKKAAMTTISMGVSRLVAGSKAGSARAGAKATSNAGATLVSAPRGLLGVVKGLGSALLTSASTKAQQAGQAMQNDSRDFGNTKDMSIKVAADLKDQVIKYLSYVGAEDIEYVQKFIEDDVLDVDALKADLKKRNDDFEQSLLKDLEEAMGEAEEDAKESGKKVKKKEVKVIDRTLSDEAFVAKTAVVKLAYENPKYRPQLLQLLQVPRSHYALADIRACLSN